MFTLTYMYVHVHISLLFLHCLFSQGAFSEHEAVPSTSTTSIDMPSLWNPQHINSRGSDGGEDVSVHEVWITRLATALLDCGGVVDPVLTLVKPVCQVKASTFCDESRVPYSHSTGLIL